MSDIILFGAGTIGRLIARQLIHRGTPPAMFADNDKQKWGTKIEGISVASPEDCRRFGENAKWVATVHRIPARPEILAQLEEMKVEQISLYEFLPATCDLPPHAAIKAIQTFDMDSESWDTLNDQIDFRRNPSTYIQRLPSDIANVYFEDFFTRLDNEHFVDCGAADGDTIREFRGKWSNYGQITAFEPDEANFEKLVKDEDSRTSFYRCAVSDHPHTQSFFNTGDQTAHLADAGFGKVSVMCETLDRSVLNPTFIKMDIEGSELEGLWGAREIIKKHSPVLAICAYHLGSHLWEIPLLIHALNPTYKFYFRRYLEATWELIYYAVPPYRVVQK